MHAPRGSFAKEALVTLTDVLDRLVNVALNPLLTQNVSDETVRKCLLEVSNFSDDTWELLLRTCNRFADGKYRSVCLLYTSPSPRD